MGNTLTHPRPPCLRLGIGKVDGVTWSCFLITFVDCTAYLYKIRLLKHHAVAVLSGEREHRLINVLDPATVLILRHMAWVDNSPGMLHLQHTAVRGTPIDDPCGIVGDETPSSICYLRIHQRLVYEVQARLGTHATAFTADSGGHTIHLINPIPLSSQIHNLLKMSMARWADR